MNSHEINSKVSKFIQAYPPLIIAHNCGYIGYARSKYPKVEQTKEFKKECKRLIYSKEATLKAYVDSDYLEIDLILKDDMGEKKWWYFHDGLYAEDEKRKHGISFETFLDEFNTAATESSKDPKPGIFLDLKKHLYQDKVNELMTYINLKYEEGLIPEGTPLMIFTGRGWIPHFHAVYRHTTRYFLKWLANADKESFLNKGLCPKFTLVTREIDVHKLVNGQGLLEPIRKSKLNPDELKWFNDSLNGKLGWGFNPYTYWLNKYFRKYFKKDYGVFENGITLIPWFTNFLPWFSKLLPVSKLEDESLGWKKVIETIQKNYEFYVEEFAKRGEMPKSAFWGIITYEPNGLLDFLRKSLSSDIESM
jgi:hypothetical protein